MVVAKTLYPCFVSYCEYHISSTKLSYIVLVSEVTNSP